MRRQARPAPLRSQARQVPARRYWPHGSRKPCRASRNGRRAAGRSLHALEAAFRTSPARSRRAVERPRQPTVRVQQFSPHALRRRRSVPNREIRRPSRGAAATRHAVASPPLPVFLQWPQQVATAVLWPAVVLVAAEQAPGKLHGLAHNGSGRAPLVPRSWPWSSACRSGSEDLQKILIYPLFHCSRRRRPRLADRAALEQCRRRNVRHPAALPAAAASASCDPQRRHRRRYFQRDLRRSHPAQGLRLGGRGRRMRSQMSSARSEK